MQGDPPLIPTQLQTYGNQLRQARCFYRHNKGAVMSSLGGSVTVWTIWPSRLGICRLQVQGIVSDIQLVSTMDTQTYTEC